jgi:hypothetical protein
MRGPGLLALLEIWNMLVFRILGDEAHPEIKMGVSLKIIKLIKLRLKKYTPSSTQYPMT